MADDVQVTFTHLEQHANAVDDVAAEVNAAADAAHTAELSNDAYGIFCQALPAMMHPLQQLVTDALTTTVDNLHEVGDKLRTAAANYRTSDHDASTRFGGR